MSKDHSRRAVLAGIAVSPALAASTLTLAGATAFSLEASHPDAELIALGRAHADLRAKYEIARDLSEPRDAAWAAALQELSETFGERHASNEEYRKRWERVDREFPAPTPSWDDVTDMMCPIEHRIMALPASTFAGLAVKARVAKSACDTYWDEPDGNCDWDQLMARKLIEAVLAAGSVS